MNNKIIGEYEKAHRAQERKKNKNVSQMKLKREKITGGSRQQKALKGLFRKNVKYGKPGKDHN